MTEETKARKREILLTNDDGISARGINALAALLREFGNVTVVSPLESQSGKSASFSMDKILRLERRSEEPATAELGSIRWYAFNGTPVDCAKMGVNLYRAEGRLPDLLASGINHGSNAASAAIYSGTLGAAREGTLSDIPSIGLSQESPNADADLTATLHYSRLIVEKVFEYGLPKGTFLNVNVPDLPLAHIKGFRAGVQGLGRWEKEFERRVDPRGREYFWIVGEFVDLDVKGSLGDHKVLEEGYVSVCPMKVDATDYDMFEELRGKWGIE